MIDGAFFPSNSNKSNYRYLSRLDQIKMIKINKQFAKLAIATMNNDIQKDLHEVEIKIKFLREVI